MIGSATFTIEPSTTSRNVTAHSSASVTVTGPVARNDPCGGPSMQSWRRSRPGDLHHWADLDPAADPHHRAVRGQRQRGVHVLGGHYRVGDHPGIAAADLAERGVPGHRVADVHQGR